MKNWIFKQSQLRARIRARKMKKEVEKYGKEKTNSDKIGTDSITCSAALCLLHSFRLKYQCLVVAMQRHYISEMHFVYWQRCYSVVDMEVLQERWE